MLVMANDKRVNEIIKRICVCSSIAQMLCITYIQYYIHDIPCLHERKKILFKKKKSERARIYNRRKESKKKYFGTHNPF